MSPELSHPALLTRANKVCAAATDHDLDRLHREARLLLDAFVEHTEMERPNLRHLPTFTAQLVRRGQERLLDEIIELTVEAEDVDGPCHCKELGTDIAMQLTCQADAERRAFGRAGVATDFPSSA